MSKKRRQKMKRMDQRSDEELIEILNERALNKLIGIAARLNTLLIPFCMHLELVREARH